ncbi:uncharacterized protein TNCV_3997721 [Trichonephila clavipes]|nr:uncharacterized protein TNCV_3997721 [Trichonephila clavipes]
MKLDMFTHLSLVPFSPAQGGVMTDIPFTHTMSGFSYPKENSKATETYYGLCANPVCSEPIGYGIAVLKYTPGEYNRIRLVPNQEFLIYVKEFGEKKNLIGIWANGQIGYVPNNVVKETHTYFRNLVPATVDFVYFQSSNLNHATSQVHVSVSRQEVVHHTSPDTYTNTYSSEQNYHSGLQDSNYYSDGSQFLLDSYDAIMTTEIDFPSLPSAPSATMDTDPPLTDSEVCAKMRELRQDILLQSGSIQYLEFNLKLAVAGEVIQPQEQITKLAENVKEMKDLLEHKKGELASFSVCPIPSCQYHATINSPERIKTLLECTKSLENKPFPISLPSRRVQKTNSVNKNNVKKNKVTNKPNVNLNKNKNPAPTGLFHLLSKLRSKKCFKITLSVP